MSLLTYPLLLIRLWDLRNNFSLPVSVLCCVCLVFLPSLNESRFYVAAAILFFSTRFIASGRYLFFALFVFLAYSFHKSAIVGLSFLVIRVFWLSELSFRKKVGLILLSPIIVILAVTLCMALVNSGAFDRYFAEYMTNDAEVNLGLSVYYLALISIVSFNACIIMKRMGLELNRLAESAILLTAMGFIPYIAFAGIGGAQRLIVFYRIFEVLVIAWLWAIPLPRMDQIAARAISIVYPLYFFASTIMLNSRRHSSIFILTIDDINRFYYSKHQIISENFFKMSSNISEEIEGRIS